MIIPGRFANIHISFRLNTQLFSKEWSTSSEYMLDVMTGKFCVTFLAQLTKKSLNASATRSVSLQTDPLSSTELGRITALLWGNFFKVTPYFSAITHIVTDQTTVVVTQLTHDVATTLCNVVIRLSFGRVRDNVLTTLQQRWIGLCFLYKGCTMVVYWYFIQRYEYVFTSNVVTTLHIGCLITLYLCCGHHVVPT